MGHTLSARPRTMPRPARVHVFTCHRPGKARAPGPGASSVLVPGGIHCPLSLQNVLWELPQDPKGQALSVGLEGALK